jgi:hypothetical protein
MLNEHQQELMTERIIKRVQELDEFILTTIGNRVKQIGTLRQTELHQIKQMLKYGKDLDEIKKYLAKVTQLNMQDITKIFEEEAKINQDFAKQYYLAKGKDFLPYESNLILQNQVKSIANITLRNYLNISKTTAFVVNGKVTPLSMAYRELIDKSITAISQGKETYQQVMKNALLELGNNGIRTIDYNGQSRRLDTALRMNIMDGMRTLSNQLQEQFGNEFGADGIEISVHSNPAPDHEDIQGRQFRIEEYDKLEAGGLAVDYKGNWYDGADKRHISTLNCYHYIFRIVLGVNKPQYTDEQLKAIQAQNQDGFILDGKHYTMYEGTQLQRRIETEVRKEKEKQILGKASGNDAIVLASQSKISQLNKKYKQLLLLSGLPMKKQRMSVIGYKRTKVAKA